MGYDIEKVELTEAQAREMAKACGRAKAMYDERWEAENIADALRILKNGAEDVQKGEKPALYLSIGMKGDDRKELANILSLEVKMAKRKVRADVGDGRKVNALERAVNALMNPEIVDSDDVENGNA